MPRKPFPAIHDLVRRVERIAASRADPLELVATVIRLMGDRGADPYLLIGVLVEGAVHTLFKHIPADRQTDTAEALAKLLTDRLKACGLDR